MNIYYLYLLVAIVLEVIGTTALKSSDGFTRLWPSLICAAGYAGAFYLLALCIRVVPVGVAYAIWSAVGIVLIALIGWVWFKQVLDMAAILGMALIIAGVVILTLFSRVTVH